jgi:hypothetical protein
MSVAVRVGAGKLLQVAPPNEMEMTEVGNEIPVIERT